MKRRQVLAGLAGLAAGRPRRARPRPAVQLGAIEILSGPNAAYGDAIKAGLELALAEVNAKGVLNGRKINLIVEDSAANKDQAINAARKLIGRDKVVAIIGPTLSNEMFAVGPVANERQSRSWARRPPRPASPRSATTCSAPACPRATSSRSR